MDGKVLVYLTMEPCVDDRIEEPDSLAHRLKSGDRDALAALFSEHWQRLWRMVNFRMDRRLLGRVDADDVLQEAYLAAADRLQHFRDDSTSSPFVWLRLVVLQTLTDVHRHHLGAQMRDADREVDLLGCRYPVSTTAALAAQLVGNVDLAQPGGSPRGNARSGGTGHRRHGPAGPRGLGAAAFRGTGQ